MGARPSDVMAAHAALRDRMLRPSDKLSLYMRAFGDDVKRAEGWKSDREIAQMRASIMFAPYNIWAPGWERKWLQHVSAHLFTGRTYQVTAEIVRVLEQASQDVEDKLERVQEREMPSEAGFVWLDKPLMHRDVHGLWSSTRALSWGLTAVQVNGMGNSPQPSVRICCWSHVDDPDDYIDRYQESWGGRAAAVRDFGELTLSHTLVLPFNLGVQQEGKHDSLFEFVHLMWVFMGMEIITKSREPVSRQQRRRSAGSLKHSSEVTVVTLRRASPHPARERDPDHEPVFVDWSCRWIVQGHGRHLDQYEGPRHQAVLARDKDHCKICGVRATWVRPYIKGPDNKPLRSAEQLFRLSR